MIRILGFLAIIAGTTGCGVSIVKGKAQEMKECKDWIYILSVMDNEMAFQKSTLPEICLRISRQTVVESKKRVFLKQVYEQMQEKNGESFQQVWSEAFEKERLGENCSSEILEELEGLGERMLFEDVSMQRSVIEASMKRLEDYLQKRQKESEKESKVTLCMGIMSGILITVLLI